MQSEFSKFEGKYEEWLSKLEFETQFKIQFWGDTTPISDIEQRYSNGLIDRFELLEVHCQWNTYKKQLLELGCYQIVDELLKSEVNNINQVNKTWVVLNDDSSS